MNILTHQGIDRGLCGEPKQVEEGFCRMEMAADSRMAVDETGLVHGGFIFCLADHAAMLAVNDPYVVLGAAEVKFLKPVTAGDVVTAEAEVMETAGRKHTVEVRVKKKAEEVFSGSFACVVLEQHVLVKQATICLP